MSHKPKMTTLFSMFLHQILRKSLYSLNFVDKVGLGRDEYIGAKFRSVDSGRQSSRSRIN